MLQQLKEASKQSWFGHAATAIGAVVSIIGLWVMLQGEIEDSVKAGVVVVTESVERKSQSVIELFRADLNIRKKVLDREIESMERENIIEDRDDLERKRNHRDDIEYQIEEIQRKWPYVQ